MHALCAWLFTVTKGRVMVKCLFAIIIGSSAAWAFSGSADSSFTSQTIESLKARVDSLEVKVRKLTIDKSDSSAGILEESGHGVKGVYVGMHLDVNITDVELGYMFKFHHTMLGASMGLLFNDPMGLSHDNEISRPMSLSTGLELAVPLYWKVLSLSGNAKLLMLIKNDNGKIEQFYQNGMYLAYQGIGGAVGTDVNVSITRILSLSLGGESDCIVNPRTNYSGFGFISRLRFGFDRYF